LCVCVFFLSFFFLVINSLKQKSKKQIKWALIYLFHFVTLAAGRYWPGHCQIEIYKSSACKQPFAFYIFALSIVSELQVFFHWFHRPWGNYYVNHVLSFLVFFLSVKVITNILISNISFIILKKHKKFNHIKSSIRICEIGSSRIWWLQDRFPVPVSCICCCYTRWFKLLPDFILNGRSEVAKMCILTSSLENGQKYIRNKYMNKIHSLFINTYIRLYF
jgi:hypothetical protein